VSCAFALGELHEVIVATPESNSALDRQVVAGQTYQHNHTYSMRNRLCTLWYLAPLLTQQLQLHSGQEDYDHL